MGTAGTAAGLLVGSCLGLTQNQVQIIAVAFPTVHSPIAIGSFRHEKVAILFVKSS